MVEPLVNAAGKVDLGTQHFLTKLYQRVGLIVVVELFVHFRHMSGKHLQCDIRSRLVCQDLLILRN